MKAPVFYLCEHCGNLAELVQDAGVTPMCCGQKMKKLVAGEVEASLEKHVPVVEINGDAVKVSVGSVTHPMTEEHSITWITLYTDKGAYRKMLAPGEAPVAEFVLKDEKAVSAYAYCNLHGLWKADI